MRLATWNINSVRLRINLVTDFLRAADIDVLCLQETKTEDAHFPAAALAEAGFFVPAIRPPSVPEGESLLRVSLSWLHDDETLERLASAIIDHVR